MSRISKIKLFLFTWGVSVFSHSLSFHARNQTLLESTKLTMISSLFVDYTILVLATFIDQGFLDCSFKKSFTSFTTVDTVMITTSLVTANSASSQKLCVDLLLLLESTSLPPNSSFSFGEFVSLKSFDNCKSTTFALIFKLMVTWLGSFKLTLPNSKCCWSEFFDDASVFIPNFILKIDQIIDILTVYFVLFSKDDDFYS
ncbi:hypothetical protein BpHYR1_015565 [Brachionus plicatilis]|uniref:Uncharacterized protein n=1 Tax=Brachionus plicatilis TaxID=10195 RepID=A0A3M7S5E4_BRAPC|nr:hypothetical protein BpHYR1_015565 [Brachionus plicatilis]